ncbi:Uncharacterized protein APZ42_005360, partial [Daphnia magna]
SSESCDDLDFKKHKGPTQKLCVKAYEDRNLCPVHALHNYIYLSDCLRNNQNSHFLFIGLVKPFKPVTGNTIGRWIKSYLKEAGIDTKIFSAHSARGASASKAVANKMSVDSIIRIGRWSNHSTFQRFYNRETPSNTGSLSFDNLISHSV